MTLFLAVWAFACEQLKQTDALFSSSGRNMLVLPLTLMTIKLVTRATHIAGIIKLLLIMVKIVKKILWLIQNQS